MFIPGLSMIEFQSIVANSSLKVSEQKCEKSRFLICLRLILSIVDARIQNRRKVVANICNKVATYNKLIPGL